MTEYWKSQARKYCEFCKCWFADNKVSTSFHENGKRHKENIQKHISQLSKKSAKEHKQKEKEDDDMKKMEAAAMAAYLKDVKNNADLTSMSINDMLGQKSNGDVSADILLTAKKVSTTAPVWHEVKNENEGSYYWNTVTNETTWEAPDEYLSIADQEKKKLKSKKAEKVKDKQKKDKRDDVAKEVDALLAREKMRDTAARAESRATGCGPAPRGAPYGSWTPVEPEPVANVDLQLPKTKELPPPPVIVEQETIEFKEKRSGLLGDGHVEFKKRKFSNPKRNMRQKIDDD